MSSPLQYFWLGVFGMSALINMSLQTVSEPPRYVRCVSARRSILSPDSDAQRPRAQPAIALFAGLMSLRLSGTCVLFSGLRFELPTEHGRQSSTSC